jgi:hypothetical protein
LKPIEILGEASRILDALARINEQAQMLLAYPPSRHTRREWRR